MTLIYLISIIAIIMVFIEIGFIAYMKLKNDDFREALVSIFDAYDDNDMIALKEVIQMNKDQVRL